MITDLVDYLNNNLLIAHYCGFDISLPLPSYWTFDRFLKDFDHSTLSSIMQSQVLSLAANGIIDTSFIGLDSPLFLLIHHRTIPSLFFLTNFSLATSPKQIRTVNSVYTQLPTRLTKRNMGSTGATKTMSP